MGLVTETQREANIKEERASIRHELDESKMYHPVFCLVEVPDAYWAKILFGEHSRPLGGHSYREISSKTTDTSIETMKKTQSEALATRFDEPPLYEFLDHSIDQVYNFYKSHLRPADHDTNFPHFSAFTFAVVDRTCLNSDPQQLIICSDAPDFGEADNAIVLKQMRIRATMAWGASVRVEELTLTPMEATILANDPKNKYFTVLKMEPTPPRLVPADQSTSSDELENDEGVLYVFAKARAKKRAGIKAAESKGWVPGKGWPEGTEGHSEPFSI